MAQWLDFEEKSTQYLNNNFGDWASFRHLGSSDATVPDISVKTKTGKNFYMDAKLTPAHCGQFVLLPNVAKRCFEFSKLNKTELTPQVEAIIKHMNADFDAYKEAGTAGKVIDLKDGGKTFSEWIIATYSKKGTEFFITNEYVILPLYDFEKHFEVSATYRIKRSGSRSVGKRTAISVLQYIIKHGYPITDGKVVEDKLFVFSSAQLHNKRFVFGDSEYMFSWRDDKYEVRRLSNTFNANVIFVITKKQHRGLSKAEFVQYLG